MCHRLLLARAHQRRERLWSRSSALEGAWHDGLLWVKHSWPSAPPAVHQYFTGWHAQVPAGLTRVTRACKLPFRLVMYRTKVSSHWIAPSRLRERLCFNSDGKEQVQICFCQDEALHKAAGIRILLLAATRICPTAPGSELSGPK